MNEATGGKSSDAHYTRLEMAERLAIWAGLYATGIQALLTLIFNAGTPGVPMTGSPDSVAIRGLLSAVVISVIVGPIAYIRGTQARNQQLSPEFQQSYRISVVPMTLAVAAMVALIVAWGFQILDRAFQGVVINPMGMLVFLAALAGSVAYSVARTMARLRTPGMLYLVVASLFGTLLFSGARNDDPYWREYSFSHLGMTPSNSKPIFNFGLIFTGLLIVVWQEFFMKDVMALVRRNLITERTYRIFRLSLIAAGILLAMVGIVRFGIGTFFNIVHDISATGTGVIVGLLMLTMWKLNPHYVREFYYLSVVIAVGLVAAAVFKVAGFVGLTYLEMIGFVLASLWLILFLHNTELLLERVAPELREGSPIIAAPQIDDTEQ